MNNEKNTVHKGMIIIACGMTLLLTALLAVLSATDKNLTGQENGLVIGAIALAGSTVLVLLAAILKKKQPADDSGSDNDRRTTAENAVVQSAVPRRSIEQKPALMLLTLFQEKGRLVDFLMEDIDQYPNEKVGAAARVVHQGCKEVLHSVFDPTPVSDTKEKSAITLDEHYASEEYELSGSVGQKPPFNGKLLHRGWRAQCMKLPSHTVESGRADSMVIVPARVEV